VAGALVVTAVMAGCGGDDDDSGAGQAGGPNPQPAFYLTADTPAELKRRANRAGAEFARSQGRGRSILILDFGGARLKHGVHGVSLRQGTFFTNDEVGAALEEAARGYADHRRHGSATIVYVNSNAFIIKPGPGYTGLDTETAREAGVQQAKTVAGLDLPRGVSASVGGDIEPGYDLFRKPEVSIAMVAGANSVSKEPYFDVGTAPCEGEKCLNGWTPQDLCKVSSGAGVEVLPEVYSEHPEDQPSQWAEIQKKCGIDSFAGVSAIEAGSFTPRESWHELRERTSTRVEPVIVVFPAG